MRLSFGSRFSQDTVTAVLYLSGGEFFAAIKIESYGGKVPNIVRIPEQVSCCAEFMDKESVSFGLISEKPAPKFSVHDFGLVGKHPDGYFVYQE